MKIEVQIGCDEMIGKDLPDLMEWLEKRVSKRKGAHPPEMVLLALLAAECWMEIICGRWQYEESAEEFFDGLRSRAKELGKKLVKEDNGPEWFRGRVS